MGSQGRFISSDFFVCLRCHDNYYILAYNKEAGFMQFDPCKKCNKDGKIPMINIGTHTCYDCQRTVQEALMFFLKVREDLKDFNYRISVCPKCFKKRGLEWSEEERDKVSVEFMKRYTKI